MARRLSLPNAEHQEWYPPVPQQHVIFLNPGYKIEASIWHPDVKESARCPGPIASSSVIDAMDSPYIQTMSEVVRNQQTTLSISIAMLQWRIFVNFRGIARSFNSK